jgi:hypothetical protein
MEGFSVRTTLNEQDWHAYQGASISRMANAKRTDSSWLMRLVPTMQVFALIGVFVIMMFLRPPLLRPEGFLLVLATLVCIIGIQRWLHRRVTRPMKGGSFLGALELEFDSQGFRSRRSNSETSIRWPLVNDVTHTSTHVFVWVDAHAAYVIPARDLPPGMTSPAAAIRIQELKAESAAAPAETGVSGTSVATSEVVIASRVTPPRMTANPSVVQELRALLRLQTWGLVDGARLYGRDATILLLGTLSFALWAFLDWLGYQGEVELYIYGLAEIAALVLGVLVIAWVISRLTRPRIELRRGLLLTLGFLPVFVVVMWVSDMLPTFGAIAIVVLLAAAGDRYLRAGLRSITGASQNIAVPAALVGTVLLVCLSTQAYFSPSLWTEREEDTEQTEEAQRNQEQIVFEQSARIDADVSSLAPRISGKPNMFFVGFAGFGAQQVFADEIGLAARRIGERYGAARRSVLLVNNERDVLKYPLATVPSLRHTLNALSQHMNPDEDVLFLALSSHGSEEGTVSVSSGLGYWRDLDATELAGMLRESGIRWRVIVVSACYAGSFVEPLKNDNTIILTAAAEDRTSFGCSDDNDLTYFGEAFYRDALPKAPSLRAAFEAAKAAILKRETEEGETPSNPQAYFGKAIEQKLAAMDAAR